MALTALRIPPGVYRNGTEYQSAGRWFDANLVRWFEGTLRPWGGWRKRSSSQLTGSCRGLITWRDNSVASVGYNGFPPHAEEDWSDRDERRKFVIHAEQNALRYVRPNECRLLACTLLPCGNCLRMISAYGITEVVYREHYAHDDTAIEIADRFGINLITA